VIVSLSLSEPTSSMTTFGLMVMGLDTAAAEVEAVVAKRKSEGLSSIITSIFGLDFFGLTLVFLLSLTMSTFISFSSSFSTIGSCIAFLGEPKLNQVRNLLFSFFVGRGGEQ